MLISNVLGPAGDVDNACIHEPQPNYVNFQQTIKRSASEAIGDSLEVSGTGGLSHYNSDIVSFLLP